MNETNVMNKNANKLNNKLLIFKAISLLIAGGLVGTGFALDNSAAIGYGLAVMVMPLLTLRINAGVSVKRNFVGIAVFALGVALFEVFSYLNSVQAIPAPFNYLGLSSLVFMIAGIWVALGFKASEIIIIGSAKRDDCRCCNHNKPLFSSGFSSSGSSFNHWD